MIPQIPGTTETVDLVFLYIFGIAGLMLVGITATMITFIIRYHRRRQPKPTPSAQSSLWLEIIWTVVPTLIVLGMFWYSWNGYLTLVNVPPDALKIEASARKWFWSFTYENGKTSNRLVVPAGKPVRVAITSEDVLHSFYIPAFRVKKDAVPGITTQVWFRAPEPDTFDIFCAEYCGLAHSSMIAEGEAIPEAQFARWLVEEEAQTSTAEPGLELLTRYGCNACHSLDGTKMIGPTFRGLFGSRKTVTTQGQERTIVVNEDYLRRAILEPNADMVPGYPPLMPSFKGRISEAEMAILVEFLTQSEAAAPENR